MKLPCRLDLVRFPCWNKTTWNEQKDKNVNKLVFLRPKTNLETSITFSYLVVNGCLDRLYFAPSPPFFFKVGKLQHMLNISGEGSLLIWDKITYAVQLPSRKKWGKEYKQALYTNCKWSTDWKSVANQRNSNLKQVILTVQFNKVYSTQYYQEYSELDILTVSLEYK